MESPDRDQLRVELPEDMVREILKKLPVSRVSSFSSVCKLWRYLAFEWALRVRNPYFGGRHLDLDNLIKHCTNHLNVVFLKRSYRYKNLHEASLLTDRMLPLLPSHNLELKVMGACNGIVCLAHKCKLGECMNCNGAAVHLYNPITREDLELPPGLLDRHDARDLGFGFDASCNDYKVVRIMAQEIYKLSTRCWTKFDSNYDHRIYSDRYNEGGVFLNGFFHWPILRPQGPQGRMHRMILTFDFEAERFGEMYYPRQQRWPWNWECLTELDNSLATCSNGGAIEPRVEVWVMKEHGREESWTKTFSVDFAIPIIRVLSVRVSNASLEVLGVYKWGYKETAVAWVTGGGECTTLFGFELGFSCSCVVFRPSLVSLSHRED